jgi:hypothetical protein
MELAGLEPATSWVRCGEPISGESRRFRLYRAIPQTHLVPNETAAIEE